jgi:hypothetical protein
MSWSGQIRVRLEHNLCFAEQAATCQINTFSEFRNVLSVVIRWNCALELRRVASNSLEF